MNWIYCVFSHQLEQVMSEDIGTGDNRNEQDVPRDGIVIDGHLANLVSIFNDTPGLCCGITLTVGGTLISGQLISGKEYFDALANLLHRDDFAEDSIENTLSREMMWMSENIYSDSNRRLTGYIHIKDARHYCGVSTPQPTSGAYWRGRLCDVSGFTLGLM